jgi:hypothetical protein
VPSDALTPETSPPEPAPRLRAWDALRRWLAGGWAGVGVVIALHWWRGGALGAARQYAALAVVGAGAFAALVAAIRPHVRLRLSVRVLAVVLSAVLLASLIGLHYHLRTHTLPGVPQADVPMRHALLTWLDALQQMAIAVGYVTTALLLLPPTRRGGPAVRP